MKRIKEQACSTLEGRQEDFLLFFLVSFIQTG